MKRPDIKNIIKIKSSGIPIPVTGVPIIFCGFAFHYFIENAEKHSREFYTGFLGPVGIEDLIQLFVNLRCMKVGSKGLILFIGGGITHDSVAEEEWEETEIKADTLLSVLHQIR